MPGENARSRRPAIVNVASGVILVVAIAVPALRPTQPPPPVVAEFAPVVHQEIKAPQQANVGPPGSVSGPSGAGGGGGAGKGAAGGSGASPGPGPGPSGPPNTGNSKPCSGFGSPPRTTPDPQSPICVPFWTGNNGGATSRGVTASTIVVANPQTRDELASPSYAQDLLNYFNSHFQTYNRRVVFANYPVSNGEGPATTSQMNQDASFVNSTNPFADISYKLDNNGQSFYFYDQLKADGIISMEQTYTDPLALPEAHLTQNAPYEWTYAPPEDKVQANVGDFVCQSLGIGGSNLATFAASPLSGQPRKVGIARVVDQTAPNSAVDPSALVARLRACGNSEPVYQLSADGTNNVQTFDCSPAIRQFVSDKVTTLIVLGQTSYFGRCLNQANTVNYVPEWIAQDIYEQDNDQATNYFSEPAGTFNEATGHVIGVQSFNKSLPVSSRYSEQAGLSVDPAYREPLYPDVYYNLMMLFTGIQYAGPNLTPQTFQDGMFKAGYPDPGAGAPPSFQAQVGGWAVDKHSEVNDFAPVWFSGPGSDPSKQAPDGSLPYSWCYVDGGVRYSGNRWPPLTAKFFHGACH